MRRITIRSLMACVLVSAVGLAALRNASGPWAGIILLLALAVEGVALLGAALMRGGERAWWLGFAVFAGGYLVVALSPVRSELATTMALIYVHSRLEARSDYDADLTRLISLQQLRFTLKTRIRAMSSETPAFPWASNNPAIAGLLHATALLDGQITALEGRMRAMREPDSTFVDDITPVVDADRPPVNRWRSVFPGAANLDVFQRVGHSLFALLAGLVGGTVALWFWKRSERGEAG
jgi:hypothetical protein